MIRLLVASKDKNKKGGFNAIAKRVNGGFTYYKLAPGSALSPPGSPRALSWLEGPHGTAWAIQPVLVRPLDLGFTGSGHIFALARARSRA